MALDNLDPESQAALDLAKRSLPDGVELDLPLLAAALCHATHLKDRYPELAARLPEPKPVRDRPPDTVPVRSTLRGVLGRLAQNPETVSAEIFLRALIESDAGRSFLPFQALGAESPQSSKAGTEAGPAAPVGWRESPERRQAIEALSSFGRMLTADEPPHRGVVEMDRALASLIRTLSRMRRRNAILVGPPGTGKSALVYELARRLFHRDPSLPERLRDLDIFELSPSFLRSGASMVGQYDERVKKLLEVLRAHPRVVLFVDEIHSLFQSGIHERGPFTDANESFKGALGRGEIACLGCTTPSEYRYHIEPDKALARRFNVIRLEPPDEDATLRILEARRPAMLDYYAPLAIPDAILRRAVALSDEYLPTRFQPDKSIQLLDDACAWCATARPPRTEVCEEALWAALEDLIGHSVVRADRVTEEEVFTFLRDKIVGQDETLRGIVRAFVSGLGGWTHASGPRGVFFFCGPTGVGKTETALRLAEVLGGAERALLEINCNTLQGSGHDSGPAINVLLGPPPGYLGFVRGGGGALSRIRDEPESIVLFDEIEKADPGVGKVLLQILDDGRVEDSEGNPLDFRRSFLVFTTNAGAVYDQQTIGFFAEGEPGVPRVDVEDVKDALRKQGYGEEFLGRIEHFFVFGALDREAIRTVIERQLDSLRGTAEMRGHALEWDPEIVEYLASAWQPRFGVRHLTTILRHRIVEQLSVAEAQGELHGVRTIRLHVLDLAADAAAGLPAGVATRERHGETLTLKLA